jgi:hypothetical protein
MPNLDELSLKKVIDLILDFYIEPYGYLEDDVDGCLEVRELITEEYVALDGEWYKLTEAGKNFLHDYIKTISEQFIEYIERRQYRLPFTEIISWFYREYNLESEEDGKEIASYICTNLHNYGYSYEKIYNSREGYIYRFQAL